MPQKHNPVIFSRQDTFCGPDDQGDGELTAPGSPSPAAASAAGTVDPRSPPVPNEVPRTPAPATRKGVPRKQPGAAVPTTPPPSTQRPPQLQTSSPLQDLVYQSDAAGTPKVPPSRPAGWTQSHAATKHPSTTSAAEAADRASGKPSAAQGSVFGMLCCCWTPTEMKQTRSILSPDPGSQQLPPMSKRESHGQPQPSAAATSSFPTRIEYVDPLHPLDKPILPPVADADKGKKCLVLDLDETLVHSSFRAVPDADYIIPVTIDNIEHKVYVCKRPGVDEFLRRAANHFEIVVYTASLNKYADPLLDRLDLHKTIRYRLFRESCTQYQGSYVKNLSLLARDLSQTIIVDNSPLSYLFHPENAIDCTSWIDQRDDGELKVIEDFCESIKDVDDVRHHLRSWRMGSSYVLKR